VADEVGAAGQFDPPDAVAVEILERLRRQAVTQRDRLEHHRVPAIRRRLHVEEQRRAALHLVGEAAPDAQREIERRRRQGAGRTRGRRLARRKKSGHQKFRTKWVEREKSGTGRVSPAAARRHTRACWPQIGIEVEDIT